MFSPQIHRGVAAPLSNSAVISFWQTEKHKQRDGACARDCLEREHAVLFSDPVLIKISFLCSRESLDNLQHEGFSVTYRVQMSRDDDRHCRLCYALFSTIWLFLAPSSFPQMMLESFASAPLGATHRLRNLGDMFFFVFFSPTLLPFKPTKWFSVARLGF